MTIWEIWNSAIAELAMLKKNIDSLYTTYCETEQTYAQLMDSHNYTDSEEKEAFEKVQTAYMEYKAVSNKIDLLKEIKETAEKLMDLTGECD